MAAAHASILALPDCRSGRDLLLSCSQGDPHNSSVLGLEQGRNQRFGAAVAVRRRSESLGRSFPRLTGGRILSRRNEECSPMLSSTSAVFPASLVGCRGFCSSPEVQCMSCHEDCGRRMRTGVKGLPRRLCLKPAPFTFRRMYRRHSSLSQCGCNVAPAEMAVIVAAEWGPVVDQLVLCSSIALAFMAGIVTPGRSSMRVPAFPQLKRSIELPRSKQVDVDEKTKSGSLDGSVNKQIRNSRKEPEKGGFCEEIWRKFDAKLGKAIEKLGSGELDEGPAQSPVLSLQAIARGPRLRLLRAASRQLCSEVKGISESSESLESAGWSNLCLDTLCSLVMPACRTCISQELAFSIADHQSVQPREAEFAACTAAVDAGMCVADASFVLDYLRRKGKGDLYADFLFFLRFQTVRSGSLCTSKVFARYAEYIFEDLVISLADAAAEIYVSRSSSDVVGVDIGDWRALLRPSLSSTRALERFRNEVALRGWLQRNLACVEAMYEDRFELWTLQRGSRSVVSRPSKERKNAKVGVEEDTRELVLTRSNLPARRSRELRSLSGWRYNYTLYLEFSDIVGPLLRALLTKLGDAISFLLVRLIGRALGLIYRGVRQSVKWSPS